MIPGLIEAVASESPYRIFRVGTQWFIRTFLTFTGGSEEPGGRSALSVAPAVWFRGDLRLRDYGRFGHFQDAGDGTDGPASIRRPGSAPRGPEAGQSRSSSVSHPVVAVCLPARGVTIQREGATLEEDRA